MLAGLRPEWLIFGLLFISGLFFWVTFLLSSTTGETLSTGWRWLEWRPLPHDMSVMMFGVFLVGFMLQQMFGWFLFSFNYVEVLPIGVMILVPMVFFQGLMSLALYLHLHRRKLNPMEVLGMENPLRIGDMVWGVVGICMCMPLLVFFSMLTEWLFKVFEWKLEAQPMVQMLSDVNGWMNWISLFLLVGFIGPLLEELVFRGFLFTWLVQKTGSAGGLILQAVFFSLIHRHTASFFPLFSLAILLGILYVYTRRLMVCVWVHALFNTMTLIFTFFFEGVEGMS